MSRPAWNWTPPPPPPDPAGWSAVDVEVDRAGRLVVTFQHDETGETAAADLGPALEVDLATVPLSVRAEARWEIAQERDAVPDDWYRRQVEHDYDSTRF